MPHFESNAAISKPANIVLLNTDSKEEGKSANPTDNNRTIEKAKSSFSLKVKEPPSQLPFLALKVQRVLVFHITRGTDSHRVQERI
jgi:hypothetical protein